MRDVALYGSQCPAIACIDATAGGVLGFQSVAGTRQDGHSVSQSVGLSISVATKSASIIKTAANMFCVCVTTATGHRDDNGGSK
jgi:hypothetical protein